MGQAASAARWTVELRADQLLGLPGNAFLEPAVQPVRLQLLRSLDPAVKTHLTRRPLRRLIGGAGVAHLPIVAPIRPVTVCQRHGARWRRCANPRKVAKVERYSREMATLRSMQSVRALTVGLVSAGVLAGAMLVGPAGTASASRHFDFPAFEEPAPPSPPVPMPETAGPANQGPANQAPPVRHRRPLDDPSVHR